MRLNKHLRLLMELAVAAKGGNRPKPLQPAAAKGGNRSKPLQPAREASPPICR